MFNPFTFLIFTDEGSDFEVKFVDEGRGGIASSDRVSLVYKRLNFW